MIEKIKACKTMQELDALRWDVANAADMNTMVGVELWKDNQLAFIKKLNQLNNGEMADKIKERTVYKHYKGKFYFVLEVAKHTETNESLVVYRAMYGDKELWIRPLEMFLSKVEDDADNPTGQEYRFMPV